MEFEKRNTKNQQPVEGSKNLPTTVLVILFAIILLLLFVGWQYLTDTPSNADEMVPTRPDVVAEQIENEPQQTQEDYASAENGGVVTDDATLPEIALPSSQTASETKVEEVKQPKATTTTIEEPKEVVKNTGGASYTHTVASGETFYSIATRYNLSVSALQNYNTSVEPSTIKVGVTKLKVPIQAIHTVGPGDVLRVVAKKYDITLEQLMKANAKSRNFAQRGEKLVIPNR